MAVLHRSICFGDFFTLATILGDIDYAFQSKDLFNFYQKLANKRSKATGGITDSYRHMREHGNSFAIVLLEVALAILLYAVGSAAQPTELAANKEAFILPYVVLVIVWVLPAALVWVIGTLFEREFSGV